jgi:hypothetical protein
MQADVIHGSDRAVDVGNAEELVAAGEFLGLVGGGKVGLGGEFDKHGYRLISYQPSDFSAEPQSSGQAKRMP